MAVMEAPARKECDLENRLKILPENVLTIQEELSPIVKELIREGYILLYPNPILPIFRNNDGDMLLAKKEGAGLRVRIYDQRTDSLINYNKIKPVEEVRKTLTSLERLAQIRYSLQAH